MEDCGVGVADNLQQPCHIERLFSPASCCQTLHIVSGAARCFRECERIAHGYVPSSSMK
jgi:hypothetical protein